MPLHRGVTSSRTPRRADPACYPLRSAVPADVIPDVPTPAFRTDRVTGPGVRGRWPPERSRRLLPSWPSVLAATDPGQRRPNQRPAARPATAAQAIRPSEDLSSRGGPRRRDRGKPASPGSRRCLRAPGPRSSDPTERARRAASVPRGRHHRCQRGAQVRVRRPRRAAHRGGRWRALRGDGGALVLIEGFGVLKP